MRISLAIFWGGMLLGACGPEHAPYIEHSPVKKKPPTQTTKSVEPAFTGGGNVTVFEDAGPQELANWATKITAATASGAAQPVTFAARATVPELFADQPVVDADGTLRFMPANDVFGESVVTVQAFSPQIDGGIGVSALYEFAIHILAINEAPSFSAGPNQFVFAGAGSQMVPGWASDVTAGPGPEFTQTVTFAVTASHPELFLAAPAVDANGALTFAPSNLTGTATINVLMFDSGTHLYGEENTSGVPKTFTVTTRLPNSQGFLGIGNHHGCVVKGEGGIRCWGYNYFGQLGDGSECVGGSNAQGCDGNDSKGLPTDVIGLSGPMQAVVSGRYHSCALTSGGAVKCWGKNSAGELGDAAICNGSAADGCNDSRGRSQPVQVVGLSGGVQAIAAGGAHTCVLTSGGGVKCWGENLNGQLGNGGTNTESRPVDVVGLTSGVQAIAAGRAHTCALLVTGAVKCWGNNLNGQLGDGTVCDAAPANGCVLNASGKTVPVGVNGLTAGVRGIGAGGARTCAILEAGGVVCWGENRYGELGDGTVCDATLTNGCNGVYGKSLTTAVAGLQGVLQSITLRGNHTCALTNQGALLCWGRNIYGQLGDGTQCDSPAANGCNGAFGKSAPVPVTASAVSYQAVGAGGETTCALTVGGSVRCWGDNAYGQLGDGTALLRLLPAGVMNLSLGIESISAGGQHACALNSEGGVKCWGKNQHGQLGDGTVCGVAPVTGCVSDNAAFAKVTPVSVMGLAANIKSVSAGGAHTCALGSDGNIACWGYNEFGQVGNGAICDGGFVPGCNGAYGMSAPTAVSGVTEPALAVAAGGRHTCALTSAGGVKCWGNNLYGQLGDGTVCDGSWNFGCYVNGGKSAPVDVTGMTNGIAAIASGEEFSCALSDTGSVKCWGNNRYGQLGDGTFCDNSILDGCDIQGGKGTPVTVSGLSVGVVGISAAGHHACAVMVWGGVSCWGGNESRQLGDGTVCDASSSNGCTAGAYGKSQSVSVSNLPAGVRSIAGHGLLTCAWGDAAGASCWGSNDAGQYGDGTTVPSSIPAAVAELDWVRSVSVGGNYACELLQTLGAVAVSAPVKCWGLNASGQLGDGTLNQRLTPVRVNGL